MLARDVQAIQATIVELVAGQIQTNKLETGNATSADAVGTIIESGKFQVWKNGKMRVEFGVNNSGDIVL